MNPESKKLTLVCAGDAFMARKFPRNYSFSPVLANWIAAGDARLVNLECVVNDASCRPAAWSGGTWAYMPEDSLADLISCGFNGCGTANNHSTDYSWDGLFLTLERLDSLGIAHAGTGADLQQASAPSFVCSGSAKTAFISVSASFHPDGRAGLTTPLSPGRPGLNALRQSTTYLVSAEQLNALREIADTTFINGNRKLDQEAGFVAPDAPGTFAFGGFAFAESPSGGKSSRCNRIDLERITTSIREARAKADAVVVIIHSHDIAADRYCDPDKYMEEFCRAAIDAGADAVIGGGTHQIKPVEFHAGKPIFYSLGNFIFQNSVTTSVPPDFCEQYGLPPDTSAEKALATRSENGKTGLHTDRANFLSFIPKIEIENGECRRVTMLPIELNFGADWSVNGLPRPASKRDTADIVKQLKALSAPYGTEIELLPDGTIEARQGSLAGDDNCNGNSVAIPPGKGTDRHLLKEILEVPSVTGDMKNLARSIDILKSWLEARGLFCTVETDSAGRHGLYAATTPGKVHDYLFVSHVDVVPAPAELFTVRTEGDTIFARGACDTKGNLVAICSALARLSGTGASVALFVATDEEGGSSDGTPQMMIDRGYIPRKMILVADTAGEEPGQLFVAEKGHAHFDLIAKGRGGHSSRPWDIDNPVPKLCEGYLKFKNAWDAGANPEEHWRTVVSPTRLTASDAGNVVADDAVMHLSCRYISMADYEKVREELQKTGLAVSSPGPGRRPVENVEGSEEIERLFSEMNKMIPGGIRKGKMSAATDASYFAGLGLPIVIITAEGGEPHSDREWASLSSLDAYADFYSYYFSKIYNLHDESR